MLDILREKTGAEIVKNWPVLLPIFTLKKKHS